MNDYAAIHIRRRLQGVKIKCVICGREDAGCDREIDVFTAVDNEITSQARIQSFAAHDSCIRVEAGGLLRALAGERLQ